MQPGRGRSRAGTIWEEERDEGFAYGGQPLGSGERSVAEPCRFDDANGRRGAERGPVEVVAGVHQEHRRHRDGRHRRRLRQGRAARLQGQGQRLVDRPERGLARHRPQGRTRSSGRPGRRPIRTSRPTTQNIDYNQLLDKLRTATLGNAAPMVVRLQILGGVEFAAKGYFQELKPEDVGYPTADFWPGAMKSVTYDGKPYGIPTNNETMAFIWNADIFERRRARPGERRRRPGTTSSPTRSRSTTSSASPATAWWPSRTPATRRSASCRSSGPTAAARSTRPSRRPDLPGRSGSTTTAPRRRCRPPTTCTCATSRCRPRR